MKIIKRKLKEYLSLSCFCLFIILKKENYCRIILKEIYLWFNKILLEDIIFYELN